MLNITKTGALKTALHKKSSTISTFLKTQKFNFGAHHSGSESDHHHHSDASDSEYSDLPAVQDSSLEEARTRIFSKTDNFSVDNLLNSMKKPLKTATNFYSTSDLKINEQEYINFLADSFKTKALEKYPNYINDLPQYQHLIPNYNTLNAYQKEVYALDTYLHWQLEVDELKTREAYNFEGSSVERARERMRFFENLVQADLNDTTVMKGLRSKLKKIIGKELEYEEFKVNYGEKVENMMLNEIVEKRVKNFYYEFNQNKEELNQVLVDLNSSANKYKHYSNATPHDHIHPLHYLSDPDRVDREKYKYLAYYEIILDQHLRQIRPSSISESEETFKYVKDQNKPLKNTENHYIENMYYDMLYKLDNEFYLKFKAETKKLWGDILIRRGEDLNNEEGDKNRPYGKLWKEEHKFPHVADRLPWEFLQETPWDKNPFVERVESHPNYQFQSFVQVPSFETAKDLCLEEGETIYENKFVYEWVMFWRIMFLLALFPLWLFIYESYNMNQPNSPEYMSRFSMYIHPANQTHRGLAKRQAERILYWGSSMWTWQLWMRKGLFYISILTSAIAMRRVLYLGNEYVVKAIYNREKDLVFVKRVTGLLKTELHVYEMHYLEQTVPRAMSGWKDLGNNQADGIFTVNDMRLDHALYFYNDRKYWNIDEREGFFKETMTFWRGLRHKDVNRGVHFNRSEALTEEEYVLAKKIKDEIKESVERHGSLAVTDYEYNYKYQLKKRVGDLKKELIVNH